MIHATSLCTVCSLVPPEYVIAYTSGASVSRGVYAVPIIQGTRHYFASCIQYEYAMQGSRRDALGWGVYVSPGLTPLGCEQKQHEVLFQVLFFAFLVPPVFCADGRGRRVIPPEKSVSISGRPCFQRLTATVKHFKSSCIELVLF